MRRRILLAAGAGGLVGTTHSGGVSEAAVAKQAAPCAASGRAHSRTLDIMSSVPRREIMSPLLPSLRLQRCIECVVQERRPLHGLVIVRRYERKAARDRA